MKYRVVSLVGCIEFPSPNGTSTVGHVEVGDSIAGLEIVSIEDGWSALGGSLSVVLRSAADDKLDTLLIPYAHVAVGILKEGEAK